MSAPDITELLQDWAAGKPQALAQLTPIVYTELRHLAASLLRGERAGHTLQPTALIHEAYLKLAAHKQDHWHSRAHFFAFASHVMRQVLSNHARAHGAAKRGSGVAAVSLQDAIDTLAAPGSAFLALDDALNELARYDARKAQLIELKYFGGLTGEEISGVLNISVSTITRESRLAEAWLQEFLAPPEKNPIQA
jgi:RNA polymerase sigma factor (TIGR02999 family)